MLETRPGEAEALELQADLQRQRSITMSAFMCICVHVCVCKPLSLCVCVYIYIYIYKALQNAAFGVHRSIRGHIKCICKEFFEAACTRILTWIQTKQGYVHACAHLFLHVHSFVAL